MPKGDVMLRMVKRYFFVLNMLVAPNVWAGDCVDTFEVSVDYFPTKVQLSHAENFSIEYFSHYKVLTVLKPWPGAKTSLRYVLVQCGTPDPPGYAGVPRIEIPVGRVVSMSTTQLPHFEALNQLGSLVAVSDIKSVNSAAVNRLFDAGLVAQVGHGASVNLEGVLDLEPDLVMAVAMAQSQYNAHPVLEEAGVKVVVNAEYTEPSLLGRSEWLKFTASIF
jgi:iron complex transport system substrate-binding protein